MRKLTAAGAFPTSAVKVIDRDGTDISSTLIAASIDVVLDSKNSKKSIVPFAAQVPSTAKTATVMIGDTLTTDDSLQQNNLNSG